MRAQATGIKLPNSPRLASGNLVAYGQGVEQQGARGIQQAALLDQRRAEMNEDIKSSNKAGMAKLGSVAGGVVGGMWGGPVGAMIGSAAGGMLGGLF
jgi:uncharacterized protein YcfJ